MVVVVVDIEIVVVVVIVVFLVVDVVIVVAVGTIVDVVYFQVGCRCRSLSLLDIVAFVLDIASVVSNVF